ncbi:MAG: DNA polymerase Y family protein, partial [Zoogloea sp.]|nr:DNA polymerase Y family protein [Zoogloea sp.]
LPLWLLPQPRPLKSAFTLLAGPERIESGWWDGAEVRRDYYVARDAEGALLWVFRPLDAPENWHLHGYFA